jgi:hypothetical protein
MLPKRFGTLIKVRLRLFTWVTLRLSVSQISRLDAGLNALSRPWDREWSGYNRSVNLPFRHKNSAKTHSQTECKNSSSEREPRTEIKTDSPIGLLQSGGFIPIPIWLRALILAASCVSSVGRSTFWWVGIRVKTNPIEQGFSGK